MRISPAQLQRGEHCCSDTRAEHGALILPLISHRGGEESLFKAELSPHCSPVHKGLGCTTQCLKAPTHIQLSPFPISYKIIPVVKNR